LDIHSLKGLADSIGASTLADTAQKLENALNNDSHMELELLIDELDSSIKLVLNSLREIFSLQLKNNDSKSEVL